VDDYPDTAESLARFFRGYGDEVQTANDGLQGIAIAEDFRPEFILLDIRMPNLNGYETARRIREQSWGREMVLIAFTACSQAEDRRLCREAGFDAHLVKPVSPNDISTLLANFSQNGQH
jgi:two-component system CheB/CheR fusion protein